MEEFQSLSQESQGLSLEGAEHTNLNNLTEAVDDVAHAPFLRNLTDEHLSARHDEDWAMAIVANNIARECMIGRSAIVSPKLLIYLSFLT